MILGLISPKRKIQSRTANQIKCHKINGKQIKTINANSHRICSPIEEERPLVVPTVGNDKIIIKSKTCVENSQQKCCKFSSRRKPSTPSSERTVTSAQSHHQFLKNKPNDRLTHSDDEEVIPNSDRSSRVPPLTRREHNNSERKRREHLRNTFINLKDEIPKFKSAEKRPSRVVVLHEATKYVCHLKDKQRCLETTLNAEVKKREKWLKILSEELTVEMCHV